jgi:putative toxin-antitoxin system antitoxin component (TIGR02293 family)
MGAHVNLSAYIGVGPVSGLDLAELVERGLPLESLNVLKSKGLTFTEMGSTVISARTLKHRKARGENLSPEETDRAVRVASVIALAEDVFGNDQKAWRWLRMEDDRLGGRTPLSMLGTESGGRLVESMLWAIDEGVYT